MQRATSNRVVAQPRPAGNSPSSALRRTRTLCWTHPTSTPGDPRLRDSFKARSTAKSDTKNFQHLSSSTPFNIAVPHAAGPPIRPAPFR
ncbi:hypothetical protein GJ744_003047 [Endocarpon pusillum]|uniref:Uncharacterized protein n=1 Tax=Endocarpon pusillum TaxID=364733 RepID=A0A8H7DZL3_9EURO|nr:hypothetical protein GJ744_003047 [Endocarpon pusillum]